VAYALARGNDSATVTIGTLRADAALSALRKSCGVHPQGPGFGAASWP